MMKRMLIASVLAAVGTLAIFFVIFTGVSLLIGEFRSGDTRIASAVIGVFGVILAWGVAMGFVYLFGVLPKWVNVVLTTSASAAVLAFVAASGELGALGSFLIAVCFFAPLIVDGVESSIKERVAGDWLRKWMMEKDHLVRDRFIIYPTLCGEFLVVALPIFLATSRG